MATNPESLAVTQVTTRAKGRGPKRMVLSYTGAEDLRETKDECEALYRGAVGVFAQ